MIYILKLKSGIELISNVSLEDTNISMFKSELTLKYPLRFAQLKTEQVIHVGFFPYLLSDSSPRNLKLHGSSIESFLEEKDIDSAVLKEYQEKTTSIKLL